MKHNLGKHFWLVCFSLFLFSAVQAANFTYDFHTSTLTPYQKEAILLSVDINQTNKELVLFFNFRVNPSTDYTVEQIDSVQDHTLHHTNIHYTYLLHPLKNGNVNISFRLIERVTDEHKVAYSFSGDRDDFKKLETKDNQIKVTPITLNVKPLPKGVKLVGNFKLKYEIKSYRAKSYAPLSMKVVLEGEGYPPLLDRLYPKNEYFTIFSQKPPVKKFSNKKSIRYKVTYALAFSAKESFTLPALRIKAFDPKQNRNYSLEIPEQSFQIDQEDKEVLVDKENNPAPFRLNWSWLSNLLSCLIVFAAGYLTAFSLKWNRKKKTEGLRSIAEEKIDACSEPKALLQLLIALDSTHYSSEIEALEEGLYKKGKLNMKKIKQSALEKTV